MVEPQLQQMFNLLDEMQHDKTRHVAIATVFAISGDQIVDFLADAYTVLDKTLPLLERYPVPGINVEAYKKSMEFLKAAQLKFLETIDNAS